MPKLTLQGGMHLEIPNREENRADVAQVMDERELAAARGVKWMRLPEMYGTAANSALTMDESHGSLSSARSRATYGHCAASWLTA